MSPILTKASKRRGSVMSNLSSVNFLKASSASLGFSYLNKKTA